MCVNIAERVSLRASSVTRCASMSLQFYFLVDLVQTFFYIETNLADWNFIKCLFVDSMGGLFLHNPLKECAIWMLGFSSQNDIPFVNKTRKQLQQSNRYSLFIQALACLSVLIIFCCEKIAYENAPEYTMTKYESSVGGVEEWKFTGKGCAVTCLGFRAVDGKSPEDSPNVVTHHSKRDALALITFVFGCKLVYWWTAKRLCLRLHATFCTLQDALDEKLTRERDEDGYTEKISLPLGKLTKDELRDWVRSNFIDILLKDSTRVGIHELDYLESPNFGVDKLRTDDLWSDGEEMRTLFVRRVEDAREFGVKVERDKRELYADEDGEMKEEDPRKDAENEVSYISVNSVPIGFWIVSLWLGVHHGVMAMKAATDLVMDGENELYERELQ